MKTVMPAPCDRSRFPGRFVILSFFLTLVPGFQAAEGLLTLDFREAELPKVLDQIAQQTGPREIHGQGGTQASAGPAQPDFR